jgi:hypothetical protein
MLENAIERGGKTVRVHRVEFIEGEALAHNVSYRLSGRKR